MLEATKKGSAKKCGTPSYKNFCANVKHLTHDDLRDPLVRRDLEKMKSDPSLPKSSRELANKLLGG